jgi:nicotinamide phosphoribosyltransferase
MKRDMTKGGFLRHINRIYDKTNEENSMSAITKADGYKFAHKKFLHTNIVRLYENYTARSGRLSYIPEDFGVVHVGLQYMMMHYMVNEWNNTFFNLSKEGAVRSLKRRLDNYFGSDFDVKHFEELHDLGYLPIEIKSMEEGTFCPYGVPCFTVTNTVDGYPWLVGFLETIISTYVWPMQTSATTATAYMKQTVESFRKTGLDEATVPFMCHDFSMRGCFGPQAAAMSGFGHLAAGFAGTDTVPAIDLAEIYYGADCETELVGCSVPATEHAIATSYIAVLEKERGISKFDAEVAFVREKLFTEVPSGIVSHVSDSYDFWKFVEEGLPLLKDDIMARDGTTVIRPDSGDPVSVLCGLEYETVDNIQTLTIRGRKRLYLNKADDKFYYVSSGGTYDTMYDNEYEEVSSTEAKGLVESLWDIFGGTTTSEGYKLLDSHIGAIYGDSITLERQKEIHTRLMAKGFAPSVVLGIGSYSYQYVTRDTHGSAIKATCAWNDKGEQIDFGKDPKTDQGKKSAKGLLRVDHNEEGVITLYQEQTPEQEGQGLLRTVFKDGKLYNKTTLRDIRAKIASQI